MPPRIPIPLAIRASHSHTSISSFIAPFLIPCLQSQPQSRSASILSSLSDNPGAYNRRIRRGRGPSSGKGKTSGRGHKGQKQHGKVPAGFNGGQTPLEVVHGIRGQVNVFAVDMQPLNLSKIQSWVDQNRLDPTRPITIRDLAISSCVSNIKDGVKLLAQGADELRTPIHIVISRASASAVAAVEKLGGSVTTRFYTPFAIKQILRGRMDPMTSVGSALVQPPPLPVPQPLLSAPAESDVQQSEIPKTSTISTPHLYRLPDPTSRKDIEYYRDPAHRGYLSHLLAEGESPSLFFRKPVDTVKGKGKKRGSIGGRGAGKSRGTTAENRIW
ncbi:MAG: YmL10 [Icmadophila ericetorum]|nr:YmL10 [Icmadophila ericetorum]